MLKSTENVYTENVCLMVSQC